MKDVNEVKCVSKVSIDISPYGLEEVLLNTFSGCIETLRCLGKASSTIEVFKIKTIFFDGIYGPSIKVHISDPFGIKTSHETDFRFIGNRDGKPTSKEVAECLVKDLKKLIKEHILRSKKTLKDVDEIITELSG